MKNFKKVLAAMVLATTVAGATVGTAGAQEPVTAISVEQEFQSDKRFTSALGHIQRNVENGRASDKAVLRANILIKLVKDAEAREYLKGLAGALAVEVAVEKKLNQLIKDNNENFGDRDIDTLNEVIYAVAAGYYEAKEEGKTNFKSNADFKAALNQLGGDEDIIGWILSGEVEEAVNILNATIYN